MEILESSQKKSQNTQVFQSYDQQKLILKQNAYDIRNQHTKLHRIAWIVSEKQIFIKIRLRDGTGEIQ